MPHAFVNGTLNFELLKNALNYKSNLKETQVFGFYWNGKHQAIDLVKKNNYEKTLLPVRKESLNFDQAQNIVIEGDNLETLKLLQKAYFNQVDVIYIDPPYNTGNDFVYNDSFKQDSYEYKLANGLIDEKGLKTTTNQASDGRFHINWLNMIYPRLLLAKTFLKDDGMIFISIDDHEYARLKVICDEIFHEDNFVTTFIWQKKNSGSGDDTKHVKKLTEYILFYAKDETKLKVKKMVRDLESGAYKESDEHLETRGKYLLKQLDVGSLTWSDKLDYPITIAGQTFYAGGVTKEEWIKRKKHHAVKDWQWRWSEPKLKWGLENGFILSKGNKLYSKQYQFVDNENQPIERQSPYSNLILNKVVSGTSGTEELKQLFEGKKVFDHPKPIDLIKYLINLHPNEKALILDFFAGSASTAHAVMDLNQIDQGQRSYVLIQIPERIENSAFDHIGQICQTRIKQAIKIHQYQDTGFKYFKLGSTNFDVWKATTNDSNIDIEQQLNIFEQKQTITDYEALLYELMLKHGLKLDWKMQLKIINEHQFWIDEMQEYCFFLKPQNSEEIFEIIKQINNQNPDYIKLQIFINEAYFDYPNGDQLKINLVEQIKQLDKQIKLWMV